MKLKTNFERYMLFGVLLLVSLVAFEAFNFGTTEYALEFLLGDTAVLGIGLATALAVGACTLDFAGIARVFTKERGSNEPMEVWLLLGAWVVAAILNAGFTWLSSVILIGSRPDSLGVMWLSGTAPIVLALFVFVIRVSLIGFIGIVGDAILNTKSPPKRRKRKAPMPKNQSFGNVDIIPADIQQKIDDLPPLRPRWSQETGLF